jgi:hypothetical protein
LEAQASRIKDLCRAKGWTLAPEDCFHDAGVSGKRANNRPGLQSAVMRAVELK